MIFIFSYWLYYILRVVLSYFDIYIPMTIFNLGLVVLAILIGGFYALNNSSQIIISKRNLAVLLTGFSVIVAFIPSLISTKNFGIPLGIYFVAIFPVLFLLISILLPGVKYEQFQYAKNIYLGLFILNFLVSVFQVIGVQTGLVGLDVYHGNEYLQAIIFPGFGVGQDQLRIPGLFSNGGVNGYFNSLLLIYLLSQWGQVKITNRSIIFAFMAIIIVYLTLTRKVWLSLLVVALVFIMLEIITNKNLNKKITYFIALFGVVLGVIGVAIFIGSNLDSSQALSTHSANERFYEWVYYFNLFIKSGWYELLFGYGVLQAFFQETSLFKSVLIDNVFFAVFIYAGTLGLITYSLFWLTIGVALGKRYQQYKFGFLIWVFFSFVSLFSTFFADISTVMFAMSVFSIVLNYEYKYAKK